MEHATQRATGHAAQHTSFEGRRAGAPVVHVLLEARVDHGLLVDGIGRAALDSSSDAALGTANQPRLDRATLARAQHRALRATRKRARRCASRAHRARRRAYDPIDDRGPALGLMHELLTDLLGVVRVRIQHLFEHGGLRSQFLITGFVQTLIELGQPGTGVDGSARCRQRYSGRSGIGKQPAGDGHTRQRAGHAGQLERGRQNRMLKKFRRRQRGTGQLARSRVDGVVDPLLAVAEYLAQPLGNVLSAFAAARLESILRGRRKLLDGPQHAGARRLGEVTPRTNRLIPDRRRFPSSEDVIVSAKLSHGGPLTPSGVLVIQRRRGCLFRYPHCV